MIRRFTWTLRFVLTLIPVALANCAASPSIAGEATTAVDDHADSFRLTLRRRQPIDASQDDWKPVYQSVAWDPAATAVIVCDMWDAHHCYNAVQRVKDMAPRVNAFVSHARAAGALVIHAPSGCLGPYEDHPARRRAVSAPDGGNVPEGIGQWCTKIPAEDLRPYPIDQSDGGEDDDPKVHRQWRQTLQERGRNPDAPWQRQIDAIEIDDQDAITDDGVETWNLLEAGGIENVLLVGVHTNMCVLGRPFGLRQMAQNGKNVALVRDLTDAMYNPDRWPYVSHHTGTDLIVEYIESVVCPTIESTDLLGGAPHRFFDDRRPHLAVVVSEFEYETYRTLPQFVAEQLASDFHVTCVVNNDVDQHALPGIDVLNRADVVLLSVWRRALPADQLAAVRRFVKRGKPVVAIRTTSHGFATRDGVAPDGHELWPEFDRQVLGGHYTGHYGNRARDGDPPTKVWIAAGATRDPLLSGIDEQPFTAPSWLYKTRPVSDAARLLLLGRVGAGGDEEPVAWTHRTPGGGPCFYTSLGHPDDFELPQFRLLLRNAVYWAADQPIPGRLVAERDGPAAATFDPR